MSRTKRSVLQFTRFCVVGVLNTCVTLIVIFVCKSWLGINPYISNALGYVCGLINSFVWNKQWVFRSSRGYAGEAARFAVGFALCYAVQLLVVWAISSGSFGSRVFDVCGFALSGYGVATLVGNAVYTTCNFIYNKLFTFRASEK